MPTQEGRRNHRISSTSGHQRTHVVRKDVREHTITTGGGEDVYNKPSKQQVNADSNDRFQTSA